MSAIYLDILKDRLYVSAADSKARRSAQSTLWDLLRGLTLAMAPILSFTAEEIWEYIPGRNKVASVHLAAFPEAPPGFPDEALLAKYEFVLEVRDEVNFAMDEATKAKRISKSQEAVVYLGVTGELYEKLLNNKSEIQSVCQIADLNIKKHTEVGLIADKPSDMTIWIEKAPGAKCVRCWFTYPTVGEDPKHPQICHRCRQVLEP
jgi:isoleucyl-tRNA synthetase